MGVVLAGMAWVFVTALSDPDDSPQSGGSITTTSSTATTSAAQQALATCKARVAAGERLAQAAAGSARTWTAHTAAQLKLDTDAWTVAQAEAVWERTKKQGPDDVRRFTEAAKAVDGGSAETACRSAESATASTDSAQEAKACASRARALAAVASTGKVVNDQWAEHIEMMADAPHTNAAAYHDRWVAMVAQAQEPLQRYAAAAEALLRAPSCGS